MTGSQASQLLIAKMDNLVIILKKPNSSIFVITYRRPMKEEFTQMKTSLGFMVFQENGSVTMAI
jgi:hypothetical protein